MAKVTQEDILNFNELYLKLKTYAAVARETGFSASTVKKYIKPDYVPRAQINIIRYDGSKMPTPTTEPFKGVENYGDLCVLSAEEEEEIKLLWEELPL